MRRLLSSHAVLGTLFRAFEEECGRRRVHRGVEVGAVVALTLGDVLKVVRGQLAFRQVLLKHRRVFRFRLARRRTRTGERAAGVFVAHLGAFPKGFR